MRSWLTVVLLLAAIVARTNGSAIQFNTTTNPIRPPQSSNFVLRCSLHDTTPNANGGLVGRRKRDVKTPSTDVENSPNTSDNQKLENRRQSVTNTTANVPFITSVVITKDGIDIARMSEHFPASPVVSTPGFSVTGSLSSQTGERGFLQLSWRHPSSQQTGKYTCDVDALDTQGHPIAFSTSVEIREEEISLRDLVNHVQKMENDKDGLKATIDAQQKEIAFLKQTTIAKMNSTIEAQQKELTNLKQTTIARMNSTMEAQQKEMTNLKQTTLARMNSTIEAQQKEITNLQQTAALLGSRVFFSAGAASGNRNLDLSSGAVLVFEHILSNVGGGYDNSSGVFTCPLAGFYFFTVNLETTGSSSTRIDIHLKHNNQAVLMLYSSFGYGSRGVTNSATIKLQVGDTVSVVGYDTSQYWAYLVPMCTFSGNLLAVA